MSALREALSVVKGEIHTIPTNTKPVKRQAKKADVIPLRPKQNINGYEVKWLGEEIGNGSIRKIPYIHNNQKDRAFYIQYPSKSSDIKLPEGTVRATYNAKEKRVEFFKKGSNKPIKCVVDSKHEPLPMPRYMSSLETVEEIFDLDLETGEITSELKIDILPESAYWKLRLQEFEAQQLRSGIDVKVINFRLQKYLKNLEAIRGVTVEMLSEPIPRQILDAIEYAEKKQQAMMGVK